MTTSTHNVYQSGAAWNVRCTVYVLHVLRYLHAFLSI
jgi:hypothetical protein